jgi:hypothetical protein
MTYVSALPLAITSIRTIRTYRYFHRRAYEAGLQILSRPNKISVQTKHILLRHAIVVNKLRICKGMQL